MTATMTFETLLAATRATLDVVLHRDLPPKAAAAGLWVDASSLAWVGFTQEQESFYVAYSFGRLHKPDSVLRQRSPVAGCDYLEQWRINPDRYPKRDVARLKSAFSDLLADGIEAAGDEDADEDDIDEMRDQVVRLAVVVALGLHALTLMERPEQLPMRVRSGFCVSVSTDRENPTRPCKLPSVDDSWPETRKEMISALCANRRTRDLFLALLEAGDKGRNPDLLTALRKWLAARELSAAEI